MTQKMPIPEFKWKQSICATCEYWGGEHELDFQNAGVCFRIKNFCHGQRQMMPVIIHTIFGRSFRFGRSSAQWKSALRLCIIPGNGEVVTIGKVISRRIGKTDRSMTFEFTG